MLWWLIPFLLLANGANRNKYRRCANSPFCKRYSDFATARETSSSSETIWSLTNFDETSLQFTLTTPCEGCNPKPELQGTIAIYQPGIARITLDDQDPRRYRRATDYAFVDLDTKLLDKNSISVRVVNDETVHISWINKDTNLNIELIMYSRPWKVEYKVNGKVLTRVNNGQLLNYEFFRSKEDQQPFTDSQIDATHLSVAGDLWETWFDGLLDTTQAGPQAIGVDVQVLDVVTLHGMAEHALPWNLPMSDEYPNEIDRDEPMRFWNSDIPEFELNSPMALYASIPLLHSVHKSLPNHRNIVSGLLWVNAAETFIKMKRVEDSVKSWWASETGVLDFFLFSALNIEDITMQYNYLTGNPPMQMQNTLGFHQCRWNYESQEDILDVARRYDEFGIPFDYLWLDIDHTDNRKYFTWNNHFPNPQQMVDTLAENKHHLVAIVDPHVKAEDKYSVYDELKKHDYFLKEANGEIFRGWCWPGDTRYPDFLDPAVRKLYEPFFSPSQWPGTAPSPSGPPLPTKALANELARYHHVQIWNDMNEPSVFNKPEITVPRNVIHRDGMEHRAVHALYSISFSKTTYDSMRARDGDRRPFILTRGAYIGSHRYGSIWTGDILTTWEHLQFSIPMILHLAACGLSLSGADIGGFVGNPSPLLMERWFQLGAWYPFMRSHSTTGTRRREVYLTPEKTREKIRDIILMRYRLSPFWYTLQRQYAATGRPMISSVGDFNLRHKGIVTKDILSEDRQFIVGDIFWIKPVLELQPQATQSVVVPGSNTDVWFNYLTGALRTTGTTSYEVKANTEESRDGLVWVRGGNILFTKERHRRSVDAQRYDPFTVKIFPNSALRADGTVWIDNYLGDPLDNGCQVRAVFKPRDQKFELVIRNESPANAAYCSRTVGTDVERVLVYGLDPLKVVTSSAPMLVRPRPNAVTEIKISPRLDMTSETPITLLLSKA